MHDVLYTVTALFLISFLLTVVFSRILIPRLKRRRLGQPILEIGPSWHLAKSGTPTLGGLAFIAGGGASLLLLSLYLLFRGENHTVRALSLVFAFATFMGAIGFFDDFKKLSKRENKGLSAWQKYLLQLLVSALFLLVSRIIFGVDTTIRLPFTGGVLYLGRFYYPLALLFLTGTVNALNLTDGVDGLLSATMGVQCLFFLAWGYAVKSALLMQAGGLLLGCVLGFFCFNAHPAKVFMGDTGSLFLGGAVGALGILVAHPLLILISSGVFVLEAASVILQVLYFKLTGGKRLFLMAPLHHHLEKRGWSEWRVVGALSALGALFGVLAFLGR